MMVCQKCLEKKKRIDLRFTYDFSQSDMHINHRYICPECGNETPLFFENKEGQKKNA